MKGIDILCASQASTAICLSMDQPSSSSCSSSSNTNQFGGRAIDRHNPIITDPRRTPSRDFIAPSASSHPPIVPKSLHDLLPKAKKSSTSRPSGQKKKNATKGHDQKKKSAKGKLTEQITNSYSSKPNDSVLRRSWVRPPSDLITPPGSSRYLLGDTPSSDAVSVHDPVLAISEVDKEKFQVIHQDENNHSSKPSSSSLPKTGFPDQVVVLRVSLHCKGCEGKVRKHLSRMRGVSSFNIDFAAKKVTVVGDVTPLSVLASISKVKNAQFWPEPASVIGSGTAERMKTSVVI